MKDQHIRVLLISFSVFLFIETTLVGIYFAVLILEFNQNPCTDLKESCSDQASCEWNVNDNTCQLMDEYSSVYMYHILLLAYAFFTFLCLLILFPQYVCILRQRPLNLNLSCVFTFGTILILVRALFILQASILILAQSHILFLQIICGFCSLLDVVFGACMYGLLTFISRQMDRVVPIPVPIPIPAQTYVAEHSVSIQLGSKHDSIRI